MAISKIKIGSTEHEIVAAKLGSSTVGSTTNPIYLNGGTATACTYTLAKSVPSDAKFTDTTYNAATQSTAGLMSASDKKKLDGIATGANNYTYTLPTASSSTLGGVKTGSNITNSSGTISLTKANVTSALGYTPPTTNTTYSAGTGISLSGTTFSNSGVRSITTGSSNGTISVNTNGTSANVAVQGLGSAAYTASTAYATAAQGTLASNALPKSGGTLSGNLTIDNAASSQSGEPYIQWATVGSNKPYTGFAHDQTDGTFIICSMEKDTTTYGVKYYKNGLAIGGGSGNLFWKGDRIATASDLATKAPQYTYGTAGKVSGTDTLTTGTLYIQYE